MTPAGLSMPADQWHEAAWQAACAFMQERWPQVEALAEAPAGAWELDGDSIRASSARSTALVGGWQGGAA